MTVHLISNQAVTAAAARAGQALAPAAAGRELKAPKDPTAAKRARDYRERKRAAVTDDGVPRVTATATRRDGESDAALQKAPRPKTAFRPRHGERNASVTPRGGPRHVAA